MKPMPLVIVRWIARLSSVASLAMLALFLTDSPQGLLHLSEREAALFVFFPAGVAVGMILGWWRELPGGLVTLGSLAMFYVVHFAQVQHVPAGSWFAIFASPGLAFLLAGLMRQNSAKNARLAGM